MGNSSSNSPTAGWGKGKLRAHPRTRSLSLRTLAFTTPHTDSRQALLPPPLLSLLHYGPVPPSLHGPHCPIKSHKNHRTVTRDFSVLLDEYYPQLTQLSRHLLTLLLGHWSDTQGVESSDNDSILALPLVSCVTWAYCLTSLSLSPHLYNGGKYIHLTTRCEDLIH